MRAMSDISFYFLDAMMHGMIAAAVPAIPALMLFWRLTRLLAAGHRALRPFVACCAAFGASLLVGGLYAVHFERTGFEDEAVLGAMIGGGALQALFFLILLFIPRRS